MADLSSLSLYLATPEQLVESRRRTHVIWSRGLGMQEYLKRDELMDYEEHADNGKLMTWVLAPRDDSITLDFLCSCETYRRTAVVATPISLSPTFVVAYGVASVYTAPRHRGKGYAAHMMRLLHWVLAPASSLPPFPTQWGTPPKSPLQDARFSVLYSDIGEDFYLRAGPAPGHPGWTVVGAQSIQWAVPPLPDASSESSRWRWLGRDDCIDVWKLDAELMQADALALAHKKGRTVYTFLPDKGVGQFSIQRLMTLDKELRPIYPLEPWGVQLLGTKSLTFATWTFEPGTKIMVLTRLRSSAEDFPALLEALKFKAREIGFDTVETWNVPDELKELGERLGAKTSKRTDHMSATKWYGQDDAEWIFNEKFCWC
ncbi:acetyltransferase domain-containing protein [Phanerochaete sordida]|uniref:Acetyltransferase domain-containing protein n=1 Tax=Phanerochaete sordida TaxID=48140 RepID=A0A9P3G0C9_9APHY|nr:acetyltransferase domain-containing protein [Phanerochaete sordida]